MPRRRVGVLGYGSIGKVVVDELHAGRLSGCELAGVLVRSDGRNAPAAVGSLEELLDKSDIVVEAADRDVVADHGEAILAAGVDLLVVSAGALIDDDLRRRLLDVPRPGRLLLCSGAIGGLGLLRAAAMLGSIDSVRLTTTKSCDVLVADWMSQELADRVRSATGPLEVFEGSAREAVSRFPTSVNVAATLALATIGLDRTRVRVVADPDAARVRHVIDVDAAAGRYSFHIENHPSDNPRTSAITAYNVLRSLSDLSDATVVGL